MKILIVNSSNAADDISQYVFVKDQVEALRALGIVIDSYGIKGNGVFGYLRNRRKLLNKITDFKPDVIHAHYGLSGLLANLQRSVPVVTTYHGSDINNPKVYPFSKLAMILSAYNIFVSEKNKLKSGLKNKQSLIPCGVDLKLFANHVKKDARKTLGLDIDKRFILFAGSFHNAVKNPDLAKAAVSKLEGVELIELKGYTREQVALLMNAVDAVLMTSFTEGSPQFIKEAMACNCPIVSVRVGDVVEVIGNTDGCYICTYNSMDVAEKLKQALDFGKRTNGRERIQTLGLENETVALKIKNIYSGILG